MSKNLRKLAYLIPNDDFVEMFVKDLHLFKLYAPDATAV